MFSNSPHPVLTLRIYNTAFPVGRITTGYGLDGPGIFRTSPDRLWGPRCLLYIGYRVFPGGKKRPGRDADPSPTSSAVVMKGWSYTSTPPMGRTDCKRVHLPTLFYSFSTGRMIARTRLNVMFVVRALPVFYRRNASTPTRVVESRREVTSESCQIK
jgi:hypothetical protein